MTCWWIVGLGINIFVAMSEGFLFILVVIYPNSSFFVPFSFLPTQLSGGEGTDPQQLEDDVANGEDATSF